MERLLPMPANHIDEQNGEWRVKNNLHYCVNYHQNGAVFSVASSEIVPYNDHSDATCDPNHYDTRSVGGEVRKRCPSQTEHNERANNPIQDYGYADMFPQSRGRKYGGKSFVLNFGEDRPHHDNQANCDCCCVRNLVHQT